MPGIKALRKIQLGKETVAGTIVAATDIWRGMGTLQNLAELVIIGPMPIEKPKSKRKKKESE